MRMPASLLAEMDGYEFVCGSDEVGYGSWAGPLIVCATVVAKGWSEPGVTDSKKLSPSARERLYPKLQALRHCIFGVPPAQIDAMGVAAALDYAHTKAIEGALLRHAIAGYTGAPFVVIDGVRSVLGARALPKADALVPAVSAASILAKVYRDRLMRELAKKYPGYGWETNAGYGTPGHQAGLAARGLSPEHRRSYSPMREMRDG